MGYTEFLINARRERVAEFRRRKREPGRVDWDDLKTPFCESLWIRAASWTPMQLFDVKPSLPGMRASLPAECFVESPGAHWWYQNTILPAYLGLDLHCGRRTGEVCFDANVVIPTLKDRIGHVWMSLSPSEIMLMRGGIRIAKGHVVVAGLGMGYLLLQVAKRKQVDKITLVEISSELVDWIMPRLPLDAAMRKKIQIRTGNAHDIVPRLKADVALIDIYDGFANNHFATCPRIPKVWVWAAHVHS